MIKSIRHDPMQRNGKKKGAYPLIHEFVADWKPLLRLGLAEDGWQWDWTTLGSMQTPQKPVRAVIVAKGSGVWAGQGLGASIESLSREVGGEVLVRSRLRNGSTVTPGTLVADWKGPARTLLALERPVLNLAAYASGVATKTAGLVGLVNQAWKKLKPAPTSEAPRVTSTRKILPGYRDVAISGVYAGGGYSHRLNLSGGVLIKENHIAAAGGIQAAIDGCRSVAPHLLKIEVEVTDLKELEQALKAGADVVLLDNFNPEEIRAALKKIAVARQRVIVEVSGGLDESNIQDYVLDGVHILSVGALTHSVKALDLSLLVEK